MNVPRSARPLAATAEVLLFTDSVEFGGAEQTLLTLAAGLDRARWRPVLVHHPDGDADALGERAQELCIERWVVPRMADGRGGAQRLPAFVRELRRRSPAVFHAELSWPLACKYGLLGALLARVPAVVATVQLFPAFEPTRLTRLQYRLLARWIGRTTVVSAAIARSLEQTLGWPAKRIAVVHNAVDPARFERPRDELLRSELLGAGWRAVVLAVARLDAQKGLETLLRAAVDVPEARIVLAGEGSARAALEALAVELGLGARVVFLGRRRDIPELLAASDLLALPSRYEGFPLALLEAMAAGLPVVASAVAGTDELVRDGETGLLVSPDDPRALAGAIRALLGNAALAARLGAAGRASVVEQYSSARMVDRLSGIYDELLR